MSRTYHFWGGNMLQTQGFACEPTSLLDNGSLVVTLQMMLALTTEVRI